jgi:hypothetical protein
MLWRSVIVFILGSALVLGGGVGIRHASSETFEHTMLDTLDAARLTTLPDGTLHYTPNGNFDQAGAFLPASAGFNVADIADPSHLKTLPGGVRVLVWVGQCDGVSEKFRATVSPFLGDSRVFGYYLMDDPDPRSGWSGVSPCPPERLREESDWLHEHVPGTKTVIVLMNLSNARTPVYKSSYDPVNSHVDLFGLCAYPCRTEFGGCDRDLIRRYVSASDLAGIPRNQIMPIFQAFGGGLWRDDEGGRYIRPSPAEEIEIISQWRALIPNPVLDMAYSWGTQREDISLHDVPSLIEVFATYNKRAPLQALKSIGSPVILPTAHAEQGHASSATTAIFRPNAPQAAPARAHVGSNPLIGNTRAPKSALNNRSKNPHPCPKARRGTPRNASQSLQIRFLNGLPTYKPKAVSFRRTFASMLSCPLAWCR